MTAPPPPPPASARRFVGWAGVLVLLAWMGIASSMSTSAIESIEGPVPFVFPALALLGLMARFPPPRTSSAFARLGGVVLLAWLLSSFATANTTNWGQDTWLIGVIQTFQHAFCDHGGHSVFHGAPAVRFGVVVVPIALLSLVSRRRELHVLGPLAVLTTVASEPHSLPVTIVFGGVWWAGRVLRGVATRRWTMSIALVALPGAALESHLHVVSSGGAFGDEFFIFAHPLISAIAIVVLIIAGGVALRRRRVARAGQAWAAAIGFGVCIVASMVRGMGIVAGPLLVLVAAGPSTRARALLWGVGAVGAGWACDAITSSDAGFSLVAIAAVAGLRHALSARRIARR